MGFLDDIGYIEKPRLMIHRTMRKGYKAFVVDRKTGKCWYEKESVKEVEVKF